MPGRASADPSDPTARLTDALLETLNVIRGATFNESNSRLLNRLAPDEKLPEFTGDPFEWLRFKQSFESTTVRGEYSQTENMTRLFRAIKGEARKIVSPLLASSTDAQEVIDTLDLHFGNKMCVAEKIVHDLRNLPHLDTNKIGLTGFATKVKTSVAALKSLKLDGYLTSPDLFQSVACKMPAVLKHAYARHPADLDSQRSNLERLGEFLYAEAKLTAASGIFDCLNMVVEQQEQPNAPRKAPRENRNRAGLVHAAGGQSASWPGSESKEESARVCEMCNGEKHHPARCSVFKRASVDERWRLAKANGLCFNCLRAGHSVGSCPGTLCLKCARKHNTLLHYVPRVESEKPPKKTPDAPRDDGAAAGADVMNISETSKL